MANNNLVRCITTGKIYIVSPSNNVTVKLMHAIVQYIVINNNNKNSNNNKFAVFSIGVRLMYRHRVLRNSELLDFVNQ